MKIFLILGILFELQGNKLTAIGNPFATKLFLPRQAEEIAQYKGVVSIDGKLIAFIQLGKDEFAGSIGDEWKGMKIVEIAPESVTVQKNDKQIQLKKIMGQTKQEEKSDDTGQE